MSDSILGILTAVIVLVPVVLVFAIIYQIFNFASGRYSWVPFKKYQGELPLKYKTPLEKHFRYYQKLSIEDKREFERRVLNFIRNKKFVPMHGLKRVSPEMKSLISASAIQLTFGLEELYFVSFNTILVFPDEYYSAITKSKHKGEVNEHGVIAFSWSDFVKGYIDPEDTFNVGLHEMAHALSLENGIRNQEYHFLDPEKLKRWRVIADAEFEKIKMGYPTFLRGYATSRRSEFFPVCIEHFFERPAEFKEKAPHLYQALADLLNQDLAKEIDNV